VKRVSWNRNLTLLGLIFSQLKLWCGPVAALSRARALAMGYAVSINMVVVDLAEVHIGRKTERDGLKLYIISDH
jgi:hypothetical protein